MTLVDMKFEPEASIFCPVTLIDFSIFLKKDKYKTRERLSKVSTIFGAIVPTANQMSVKFFSESL